MKGGTEDRTNKYVWSG